MSDQYCDRCGKYLPEGGIRYTVHIQILSDFDGVILFEGEEAVQEVQKNFKEDDYLDEKDLEDEIFQEFTFLLCGKCRKNFAQDPFNRGTGFFKTNKNIERLFH